MTKTRDGPDINDGATARRVRCEVMYSVYQPDLVFGCSKVFLPLGQATGMLNNHRQQTIEGVLVGHGQQTVKHLHLPAQVLTQKTRSWNRAKPQIASQSEQQITITPLPLALQSHNARSAPNPPGGMTRCSTQPQHPRLDTPVQQALSQAWTGHHRGLVCMCLRLRVWKMLRVPAGALTLSRQQVNNVVPCV
jgi:hypothetical protein